MINRQKQPKIELVEGIRPTEPKVVYLDNGIPVYLIETKGQDIIKVELLFESGKWFEDKPLLSNFTNKMLKEGTTDLSSAGIADKIDFYGAHLETSSDKDMGYVSLYSLNKHLEQTLPVLADVVTSPLFPEEELETLRHRREQRFIVNNQKVRNVAKKEFNSLIYGAGHPYGKSIEKDDFGKISISDLKIFHKNYYTAANCKIIAAGKIRPDFIELLNKSFAGFNGTKVEEAGQVKNDRQFPGNIKKKIQKEDAVQSAIRIGRVLFNKKHEDYARLKIMNMVLGGYFGSRLMTNIREEKGYTYGIGSAVVSLQQSGYFFISSEVGTDVTTDALKEVYHEINVLQQDLVPKNELSLVKNYTLGSLLRSLDGAFARSENYKGLLEYGLDYNYFQGFIDVVNSITSTEIRDLACKYLNPADLTELTVGK